MRPACQHCVFKHLAQAEILWHESKNGYPMHEIYALGHLAEAEAEGAISKQVPDSFHLQIRSVRKAIEDGIAENTAIHDLIKLLWDWKLEKSIPF